jgi:hypothetical protein
MRNIPLKLFTLSVLLLTGCEFLILSPDGKVTPGGTGGTAEPFQSASPSDIINSTATPFPTTAPSVAVSTPAPTATPANTGGIIRLTDTEVFWGDLNEQEKARFTLQDFANRHVIYRQTPNNIQFGGEFEFFWDKPPDEISADQFASFNLKAQLNAVPDGSVGSGIEASSSGNAGFWDILPGDPVRQAVGWAGTNNLVQGGTVTAKFRPSGLNSAFWGLDSKINIYIHFDGGLTIIYHYKIIR